MLQQAADTEASLQKLLAWLMKEAHGEPVNTGEWVRKTSLIEAIAKMTELELSR